MPYYGSAYGVKHYGSDGMKSGGTKTAAPPPGSTTPAAPSVAPAPAVPEAPKMESDPMADSIAQLMASLQQGLNQPAKGSGNPFLDRLQAAGNPMWQYFGRKG